MSDREYAAMFDEIIAAEYAPGEPGAIKTTVSLQYAFGGDI